MTGRSRKVFDLTTKQKIMMGIFTPVILLAVISATALLALRTVGNTTHWVVHTQEVIAAAENVLVSAVDMETGLRGYLLTGKEPFLEPYDIGSREAFKSIEVLQVKVSDNPKQVQRLEEIARKLRQWVSVAAKPLIVLRRQTDASGSLQELSSAVGEAKGKSRFDELRQLVQDFQDEEQGLMDIRQAENETWVRNSKIIVGFMAAFALVLAWYLGRIATRESIQRTAALDSANTSVMIADTDYDIIYTNDSMAATFSAAETDIRKSYPGFSANQLIGSNMDDFHADQNHQRVLMDNLRSPHKKVFHIGDRIFSLVASPIIDGKTRLGTVVEWEDCTEKVSIEEVLSSIIESVAAGKLDMRLDQKIDDEFLHSLSESMNQLTDTIRSVMDDVATAAQSLANGELSGETNIVYDGVFGEITTNINVAIERLRATVLTITKSAMEVGNACREMHAGSQDLSHRTEQQAANIEETAASMEEVATTVMQNAQNAEDANRIAAKAREAANAGGEVVGGAVDAIVKIEESSQKISDILGVIDEIAFQTNLLALNAAVEAARAGDAGKGFAVVASEVGKLALRSSDSAKEIKNLIASSEIEVRNGVKLVRDAGDSLAEIVEAVRDAAEIIGEISTASREQANSVQEVNAAITRMDEMTQQNSALVEQYTASTRALEDQSHFLMESVSFFSLEDEAAGERPSSMGARPKPTWRDKGTKKADPNSDFESEEGWEEF